MENEEVLETPAFVVPVEPASTDVESAEAAEALEPNDDQASGSESPPATTENR